jgi:hypothetical protein
MEGDPAKAHRAPRAGRKAERKKDKKLEELRQSGAVRNPKGETSSNPKAFAIQHVNKLRRRVAHALDKYVVVYVKTERRERGGENS